MGSSLANDLYVFAIFRINEGEYPLEARTDDSCFFSSEMVDGFVMRCLAGRIDT